MDLPPTQKGRHHEVRAQGLRDFAGLTRDDQRLDPFRLAEYAGLLVVSFAEIEALLSSETLAELLDSGSKNWSGGAASKRLPNGKKLIILNPTHASTRHKATLMEEISHVHLLTPDNDTEHEGGFSVRPAVGDYVEDVRN